MAGCEILTESPTRAPTTSPMPTDTYQPSTVPSISFAPSSSKSPSAQPSLSLSPSVSPQPTLGPSISVAPSVPKRTVAVAFDVQPKRSFSVSSSAGWIPVLLTAACLVSALAFFLGRRHGYRDASQTKVTYDKLEFEILYLQEQLDWAIEEGDSKESTRLEKLLAAKNSNLESRKDALHILEKSEVTWDVKRMKANIKNLEEKQSDLIEKSSTREVVVRSLHEDNTLKQLKIEMLEEIVRAISGAKSSDESNYGSPLLLTPTKAPQPKVEANIYAKNTALVINGQKVTYTGPLRAGVPNGVGTFRFPNKSTYIGSIVDGKMHGNGALFTNGGVVKRGRFKNNELIASDTDDHDGDTTVSSLSSISSSHGSAAPIPRKLQLPLPSVNEVPAGELYTQKVEK